MPARQRTPTRVAALPTGRTVTTRLRLAPGEEDLLQALGEHLAILRNRDLATAVQGVPANTRSKALTGTAHSRYLGTLVKDNDHLMRLVRDGLYRHRRELHQAIRVLERRTVAPTWDSCCRTTKRRQACDKCRHGYSTRSERAMKCRRLDTLKGRLAGVESRITAREWRPLPGGRQLLRSRHHLREAGLTLGEWRTKWVESRFWLGAEGNKGVRGGNPCFVFEPNGRLTLSVPPEVASQLGVSNRVTLSHPVIYKHGGLELSQRVAARVATRFDIEKKTTKGQVRWYLRASWRLPARPHPQREEAVTGGVLGVDLNADHLAVHRLSPCGNPMGAPERVELPLRTSEGKALRSSTRDARVREAITELLALAKESSVQAVVVEDLGFSAAEKSREKYGRNKAFRHTISGFPTTAFKSRLVSMAGRQGVAVVVVDPRYTSVVGGRDWYPYLSRKSKLVTRHDGAAVAIGRRGLLLPLGRKSHQVRSTTSQRREASITDAVADTRTPEMGRGILTAMEKESTVRHPHHMVADLVDGRSPSSFRSIGVTGTLHSPTS